MNSVIGIEKRLENELIMVVFKFVILLSGCIVMVFKLLNSMFIKKKFINIIVIVGIKGGKLLYVNSNVKYIIVNLLIFLSVKW